MEGCSKIWPPPPPCPGETLNPRRVQKSTALPANRHLRLGGGGGEGVFFVFVNLFLLLLGGGGGGGGGGLRLQALGCRLEALTVGVGLLSLRT